ncbi:hypothetical protein V6N13_067366 [Hibiscus sabdariffa]
MCHMTACSLLSYIAIAWMKMVPMQTIRSGVQFLKISALSLVFCFSVVLGNISLRFLAVSFNQAVGATTPFFTAVFAYLMTFKREAWLTYITLIPVVTGVIIASGLQLQELSSRFYKEFCFLLKAVVFLLPAALIMEENVVGVALALARDDVKIIWYLLFNSALAYFVNLTNFLVTKHTSALTLQVLGNAKGAVAVVVSILIFRNPVSVTGMLGYTLTVFGVVLYGEAKKRTIFSDVGVGRSRNAHHTMLRKMQVSGATELASKGEGASDGSNVKVKVEIDDPLKSDMKVGCPCGNSLETENIIKVITMNLMFFASVFYVNDD